jgi:hypothetical protein
MGRLSELCGRRIAQADKLAAVRHQPDHHSIIIRPSFIVLDQFLVDPAMAVTASPDSAVYESAGNRSPRNDHRPNVPDFGPCRGRLQTAGLINIVTVCNHGAASGRK